MNAMRRPPDLGGPQRRGPRPSADVIEDWTVYNSAVRLRAGLPSAPPRPPRDPEVLLRARARMRRAAAIAIIALAFGLTVLLCAIAFKWTPAIRAADITLPALRLHPDDLARLTAARVAAPTAPQTAPVQGAVTNAVVFQNVPFAHGAVVTAWRYATGTDAMPSAQYCYFDARSGSGVAHQAFLVTSDGRREGYPGTEAALGLSASAWADAANQCRWHPTARR